MRTSGPVISQIYLKRNRAVLRVGKKFDKKGTITGKERKSFVRSVLYVIKIPSAKNESVSQLHNKYEQKSVYLL